MSPILNKETHLELCSDIKEECPGGLKPQQNSTVFLPKLEIELTNDPASLLVATCPREMTSMDLRA